MYNALIANPMVANVSDTFGARVGQHREMERRNALAQMYEPEGNVLGKSGQNTLAQMYEPELGKSGQNTLADYSKGSQDIAGGDIGNRLLADLQRDFGLTREQAAGIVGNLAHESGRFKSLQEISPVVKGSRGGFGYAQWTGPRRRAFEAWANENGLDPTSYEANYGFLKYELTNTPEGRVLSELRKSQSADEAAALFSKRFLRPGIPHMDNRLALARQYVG